MAKLSKRVRKSSVSGREEATLSVSRPTKQSATRKNKSASVSGRSRSAQSTSGRSRSSTSGRSRSANTQTRGGRNPGQRGAPQKAGMSPVLLVVLCLLGAGVLIGGIVAISSSSSPKKEPVARQTKSVSPSKSRKVSKYKDPTTHNFDGLETVSGGAKYYDKISDAPEGAELWQIRGEGNYVDMRTVAKTYRGRMARRARKVK